MRRIGITLLALLLFVFTVAATTRFGVGTARGGQRKPRPQKPPHHPEHPEPRKPGFGAYVPISSINGSISPANTGWNITSTTYTGANWRSGVKIHYYLRDSQGHDVIPTWDSAQNTGTGNYTETVTVGVNPDGLTLRAEEDNPDPTKPAAGAQTVLYAGPEG